MNVSRPCGRVFETARRTVQRSNSFMLQVKVRPSNSIESLVVDGISFADGHKLEADIIVFATGYILAFS